MARNYARITTTIWRDNDWRALSHTEQWAYMALLSQSKLTLAGCIDMKLPSWTQWSNDIEKTMLEMALDGLQLANMIRIDPATDELVIRTFVEHDDVLKNRNLGRGMWSAWQMIESEELRLFVVDNLPDEAWEPRFEPPFLSRKNHGLNHGSNRESNLLTLNRNHNRNLQPPVVPDDAIHRGPVVDLGGAG